MFPGFYYNDWYQRRWGSMRISDRVLKSTVFLGKLKRGGQFSPTATGFYVSHQYRGGYWLYLVTCAHAVQGQEIRPRFNMLDGTSLIGDPIPADRWFFHPDETRFIDVAVAPITFDMSKVDVAHIPLTDFCSDEVVADRDIGVGDELFFPSLFAYHAGTGRNLPIMRSGTLAGMPIEPLQTKSGPIKAYLMEGRSISGHSGSPVFINFLANRSYYGDKKIQLPHPAQSQAYRLLGLVRGFIRADDVGEYITDQAPEQEDLWVNTGISTIIPAQEIQETMLQDDLVAEMDAACEAAKRNGIEIPSSIMTESASAPMPDNSSHKEDFMRLLNAAAKSNK
jgi:hypothetical protein